jgi:hypothetical protein
MLRKLNLNSTHLSPLTFEALKVYYYKKNDSYYLIFLGKITSFTRMRYSIYRCLVKMTFYLYKNLVHYHPQMKTYMSVRLMSHLFLFSV